MKETDEIGYGEIDQRPAVDMANPDNLAQFVARTLDNVDGVVANRCLMSTLGFADALSHANVKWLAQALPRRFAIAALRTAGRRRGPTAS